MTSPAELDDRDNNLVATGALFIALHRGAISAEVVMDGDNATNQIDVRFAFLRSAYRITVERIRDDDLSD